MIINNLSNSVLFFCVIYFIYKELFYICIHIKKKYYVKTFLLYILLLRNAEEFSSKTATYILFLFGK